MKRKTTKEILADSFRELAASKNVSRITIQDIAENCGYSSATFYRNFRDKYDLIAWAYTRDVADIMGRIDNEKYAWKHTLLEGARKFMSEREYLANLFQHTAGHDAFVQYMADINCRAVQKHILSVSGKDGLSRTEEMCIRTYCLGTVCLTCEWVLGLHDAAPEDIAEIYELSLPEPLKPYLL